MNISIRVPALTRGFFLIKGRCRGMDVMNEIMINGKKEIFLEAVDLLSLVEERGLRPERVVIEHNYDVVPRRNWPEVTLRDGDNVEIVSFVGGG